MVLVAVEYGRGVVELAAKWHRSGVWVGKLGWDAPEGWVQAAVQSE